MRCFLCRAFFYWVLANIVLVGMFYLVDVFADEIPSRAARYRRELTGIAHREMGLNAEVSRLAAQVHQESRWEENARSPVGAMGLTQFMPATAREEHEKSDELKKYPIYSARWALNAQSIYMRKLLGQVSQADTECDRWALALRGYNGGMGYIRSEQRRAVNPGNAGSVAEQCYRSAASCRENREYPVKIMRRWEPLYINAGWGGNLCQIK